MVATHHVDEMTVFCKGFGGIRFRSMVLMLVREVVGINWRCRGTQGNFSNAKARSAAILFCAKKAKKAQNSFSHFVSQSVLSVAILQVLLGMTEPPIHIYLLLEITQ